MHTLSAYAHMHNATLNRDSHIKSGQSCAQVSHYSLTHTHTHVRAHASTHIARSTDADHIYIHADPEVSVSVECLRACVSH